mmetsp:Transcript_9204/g.9567  ORF Transcript_9204/g.9567 Transcript_9204/m.9567 type:complete len:531 (+) Transcript_9204:37-1629(+)
MSYFKSSNGINNNLETPEEKHRSNSSRPSLCQNSIFSQQFFDILKANNKFQLSKFIRNTQAKVWEYTEEGENSGLHFCVSKDLITLVKVMFETIEEVYINEAKDIISNWINKPNYKGDTCIHYASYKGNYNLISLLAKYRIKADIKNKQGNNVMHHAAQGNQPVSFIYFYYKYQVSATDGNIDGSTPLHWACYTGSDLAFNFIVNYYDNINVKDNDGLTPLHLAVISERTEIVKKLLHKGARKDIKDNRGRTPKDLAEEKGIDMIAEMLKDNIICSMLVWKNPLQKIERNNTNIYFFLIAHLLCEFLYFSVVLPFLDRKLVVILSAIALALVMLVYLYLIFSDPGRKKNRNPSRTLYNLLVTGESITDYCPCCSVRVVPYLKHCTICDICTEGFDHHCYWINNCIGKYNILIFRIFLVLVMINLVIMFVASLIVMSKTFKEVTSSSVPAPLFSLSFYTQSTKRISSIIMIAICFVFIIFVSVFICNQIRLIFGSRKQRLTTYSSSSRSGSKRESFLRDASDASVLQVKKN